LRLETKTLLSALLHGPGSTNFGLPNGARGLDIHDDAAPHIDQIVVGVGEEGRAVVGAGPCQTSLRSNPSIPAVERGRWQLSYDDLAKRIEPLGELVPRYHFGESLEFLLQERSIAGPIGLGQKQSIIELLSEIGRVGVNCPLEIGFSDFTRLIREPEKIAPKES
jgi:hypothetical protein